MEGVLLSDSNMALVVLTWEIWVLRRSISL
jgi:hypothetical protein